MIASRLQRLTKFSVRPPEADTMLEGGIRGRWGESVCVSVSARGSKNDVSIILTYGIFNVLFGTGKEACKRELLQTKQKKIKIGRKEGREQF